ncbi:HYR-like domain-containing protein [Winogradskyella sp. PC D3.3]
MKHLYCPKLKTPSILQLTLVLIMALSMVSFNASSQVLIPRNKKPSKLQQVPSEDLSLTNARFTNINSSSYNDLEQMLTGDANETFDCADGFGYILTNVNSSNGNVTGLYSFDLSTNTFALIKDPILADTSTSQFINAIGYNIVDNYIYGLLQGSNKVVKIDSNGDIELMTVTGLIGNNYASGDVDANGILYLYGQNRFVAIDLNPTSPDYLVANVVLQYSLNINDMTFSPVDNNIYMLTSTSTRSLLKFDTTTNTITTIGQVSGLESESTDSFGTAYMDALGNMYVANNVSGNTYKIETPHLGGLTATYYSNLPGVSPGDGARCPSQPTKPMANPDDICYSTDMANVVINVAANDSEGTYSIDITSVQLIDPITSAPSNSVTVAGQGTFTLGANGDVTFEPLSTFTGTSIAYTILDIIGYSSNLGSITINLNNTEAPTGETTQEFCENENTTIADLNVSGNNITWYSSPNNNTVLNSNTAIHNGTTYYASQTSTEGCESTERLAVTVQFNDEISLVDPEETNCVVVHGALYTIEASFTGTAPFTASGVGQPGVFTSNNDGTTTWVSSPIESTVETYNVTISDKCGSIDLIGSSPAECLNTPFDCENGFAYIIVNDRDDENNFVSGLYSYDLATHAQTLIKAPLIEDSSISQFVNGIGYNILDNNIYGIQQFTNNIVKIDSSGNIEFLPILGPFTIGDYSSGDINENGILFLYGENKFISIDLNPTSPNYLKSTTLLNYPVSINDITVSPVDGNIYMVTSTTNRKLLRFNVTTNTVDDLGLVTGLNSEITNAFGTAYMDALGNMYIANNASGNVYRIATPNTGNLAATPYNQLINILPGDGARCPSQLIVPMAEDDSVCITSNETEININVLENDSAGTYNIDVTSVQLIDPLTLLPTNTVTISNQGTFTVNSDGNILFEALPGFSGASIDYIISDIIGISSIPATITISLNETSIPTGNAIQEFCASTAPTIANLNATGENIQWYADETGASSLDSSESLIDGVTYYATQITAEGCESQERLAVTVNFTADITLVTTETLECSDDGSTYVLIATFTGTPPFTVNGTGQPGSWVTNNNDTFTWTSDAISSNESYNIEIHDVNSCNTITLTGEAAKCCEFEVTCPTFETTTVACYADLPSQTTYTIEEFEALGNQDGIISNNTCGVIRITAQNGSAQNNCDQIITRTYTITSYDDTNGNGIYDEDDTTVLNSTECIQLITVHDTIPPTFSAPADITIECDIDATDLTITGDVTDESDNCSTNLEATFSDRITNGLCFESYIITRTWSLTDDCNNTTSLIQTITVEDTTPPTFTVPADITIECDVDATDLTITGNITDKADNCSTALITSYSDSVANGDCPNTSIITRTWYLTDDCKNTTSQTQTITVQDTTAPTFSVPADITIECDVDVTDLTITGEVTDEADNCSSDLEATFSDSVIDGSCPNASIITRTWTLTDDCDNTTTAIQTITVQDTTAPTFSVPADITIECDVDVTDLTITGEVTDEADNCSSDLEATFSDSAVDGSCPNASIITRTWTLTDDCDNTTTAIQTITVQDTTAPTFSVPADITIECDVDVTDLTITGEVTDEADNCSSDLEATFSDSVVDGSCPNASIITRTWTLTDDCDNTTTAIQTITVQDTTAPTFSVPADITIECDVDVTDLTITGEVTDEADNCSSDLEATFSDSVVDGSCPNASIITRTWTLTDDCDNSTTAVQTITVQDTTAPIFNETLPMDLDAECDAVPTAETLTATDSCGTAEVTFEEEITNGTCMGDYIIERTWTATDSCGNEAVHTQIITVQDNTAPTLVSAFEDSINVTCDSIPEVPSLVFEDSCSNDIEVSFNEDSNATVDSNNYDILRTWTVTDDCGNQAVFTQTITVDISNVFDAIDTTRCILDSEFDLFELLTGDFSTDGTWTVVSGDATLNGSLFDPSSAEVGVYTFKYEIVDGSCSVSKEVTVTLDDDCVVLACGEDDVVISKTVTANGDAYNEFFTITGIEDCGFVIELQIFNRWGAEIYKSNNYLNDWNGEAHSSSVGSSGKVPTGTYYYIINLKNSGLAPFAGPIYVATN